MINPDNFDDNIQFLISKIGSNQTEFIITLIATKMFIPSYYIPGEISLVKFSLKEGITEELSRFFYPQDIPSGRLFLKKFFFKISFVLQI